MKPDESSTVTPAPPAASHRVSLSPYVNEQLPNWEELFAAYNVARMGQLAGPFAHAVSPRFIRLRDAPRYLGMDRNRFSREVRPYVTQIPIGVQGIAFDRLDLDRWADQYKASNGRRPSFEKGANLWGEQDIQGLESVTGTGTSMVCE